MIRHSKTEIINAMTAAGYRMTRQRLAIIDRIAGRSDHPSVRHVFNAVKYVSPRISLATVYNTINSLVSLGVIKKIEFEESDNRIDTNLSPHINLICTVCGSIADYTVKLPLKPHKLEKENGFKTSAYRLEYRGICQSCNT